MAINYISRDVRKKRLMARHRLSLKERARLDFAMLSAAYRGERVNLKRYLDEGANPNAVDADGCNGLMFVRHGGCLLTLLESGTRFSLSTGSEATKKASSAILKNHIENGNTFVVGMLVRECVPEADVRRKLKEAILEVGQRAMSSGLDDIGTRVIRLTRARFWAPVY